VPPKALLDEVRKLRGDEYLGANVTIPHKESVLSMMDAVDPSARLVGAVNTIVNEGDYLIGHNTDSDGFIRSLREKAGFRPEGMAALVLGAGGAARAAAFGLAREGVASLTIANRTLQRARVLVDGLRDLVASVLAVPMDEDGLGHVTPRVDLIVNATSLGMGHGDGEGRTPLRAGHIPAGSLVYDMVYTPAETPLMVEAGKAGARSMGGLWMLVFQGAASFELWTGREAPVDVMYHAAEGALAATTTAW
jgi:shikimate dehydrogenase